MRHSFHVALVVLLGWSSTAIPVDEPRNDGPKAGDKVKVHIPRTPRWEDGSILEVKGEFYRVKPDNGDEVTVTGDNLRTPEWLPVFAELAKAVKEQEKKEGKDYFIGIWPVSPARVLVEFRGQAAKPDGKKSLREFLVASQMHSYQIDADGTFTQWKGKDEKPFQGQWILNPDDADKKSIVLQKAGLTGDDMMLVRSRKGECEVRTKEFKLLKGHVALLVGPPEK